MATLSVARDNRCWINRLARQGVERVLKARIARLGDVTPPFTAHSLRSGFVTEAARAHKPIYAIRKQTRHKSVQMLERYIREVEVFVGNAAEL